MFRTGLIFTLLALLLACQGLTESWAEWPENGLSRRKCLSNGWQWYKRADGKTFCTIPLTVQDRIEQAIRNGDRIFVEKQLGLGLPVDMPMSMYYGSPMLLVALEHGRCDIAALLLEKGADVELLPAFVRMPGAPCSQLLPAK